VHRSFGPTPYPSPTTSSIHLKGANASSYVRTGVYCKKPSEEPPTTPKRNSPSQSSVRSIVTFSPDFRDFRRWFPSFSSFSRSRLILLSGVAEALRPLPTRSCRNRSSLVFCSASRLSRLIRGATSRSGLGEADDSGSGVRSMTKSCLRASILEKSAS
jgi:hypothetical protein